MSHRATRTILIFIVAAILALPARAQQKPLTQDQVEGLVHAGLGDESGAKLIEERGIDFEPSEDFLQSLKAAGANEAFLQALRAPSGAQPHGEASKKPLNQLQIFGLLAGQVTTHRVATLVQERAIDFEPKDEYLQQIRVIGGDDELINALKNAKVIKPPSAELEFQAQYLRNEMWDEALASLKEAVSKQQFDPVLRVALGETLFRTGDYEQAIRELETAKKLDPNLWQATQRMADAHLKIWELKKSLPDRVLACELYQELISSAPPNDPNSQRLAALFANWNDETSEKSDAQSRLAQLESPVGKWESESGEIYTLKADSSGWSFGDPRNAGQYQIGAVGTREPTGTGFSGEGFHRMGFCAYRLWVEITVSNHGTKLDVTGTALKGAALEGGLSEHQACVKVMAIGGNVKLHLVRKE
jgi:tetratricopeptide (TPR) repeat protein